MSTQHTPGPWSLEPVEDRSIKHLCPVDSERMSLLTIVHQDETPFAAVYKDADAHLIAAAPDLLEALQSYSLPIDLENIALSCIEFGSEAVNRELRRRAAIAKAIGGAS